MTLKLFGVPLSPFARMAHAVAELTNNEYEYIKESLSLLITRLFTLKYGIL